MKVLLTGAGGQLGTELQLKMPAAVRMTALDRRALDVSDASAVAAAVESFKPDVAINAAGYTAVNRAESEPDRASAVNAAGAGNVAAAAAKVGARIIHVSTDYVFDGKASIPYAEAAAPNPVNEYGRSKLEGERRVAAASGSAALIIRTSWVYSCHGRNFFTNMLQLLHGGSPVRMVADQVGTPTWAGSLAAAIWSFAALPGASGIYHWTDAGVASWYDFCVAIGEECRQARLLEEAAAIVPIATSEFPSPARRPPYSVLDKQRAWTALGKPAPHWRASLRQMLREKRDRAT